MKRLWKIYEDPGFKGYLEKIAVLERDRIYCRHGFDHLMDTARLAYIFALERNYAAASEESPEDGRLSKELIYAAALLHDIGRVKEYEEGISHDKAALPIIKNIMERAGFSYTETELVSEAVSEHRGGKKTENGQADTMNMLSEVLFEADKMSRQCFKCEAQDTCKWSREKKNLFISY